MQSVRCLLLYSGIHYDRIVQTFDLGAPVDADVVQWPVDNDAVLVKASNSVGLARVVERVAGAGASCCT